MPRFHHGALIALLAAALPGPAAAQSVLETVWSDATTVPGDLIHVWTGPARVDGDDLPGIVSFGAVVGFVALADYEVQELIRAHPNGTAVVLFEPFRSEHDALSRLGQNHWMLRGAGAGYVLGLATGADWLRESALGCAVGNTANALPRKAVYALVSRSRPSASPDDPYDFDVPGGEWGVHSFFGGHAANAFSCASFLAHRWDMGWGEPVVWALAVGVAGARLVDEAHWMSDTVVGSAFGFVAGRMIARRQLERAERRERERDRDSGRSDAGSGPEAGAHAGPEDGTRGWRIDGLSLEPVPTPAGGTALAVGARVVF